MKLSSKSVTTTLLCIGLALGAASFVMGQGGSFATGVTYEKFAKENASVRPSVAAYSVKKGLSNVVNYKLFKPALSPQSLALIEKNGFVATPTDFIQMYYVYENNEYHRPKLPAFITTDSMLHTYHVFYDFSLRKVESGKLFDAAIKLTDAMLAASQKDYSSATNQAVKEAALKNIAYFAVARKLLTDRQPPAEVSAIAREDLVKIAKHVGRADSAVLTYMIDFSQFVPRGHYTRSEKLKKYFSAMMWYGLAPFPTPDKPWGDAPTVRALMMVHDVKTAKAGSTPAIKLWDMIYEPTAFYVGTADDFTVYQYGKIMDTVYGADPAVDDFGDSAKLKLFVAEVAELPGPKIANYVRNGKIPTGPQFRFMGQRFIPDSRIMQELTHPKVDGRNFPKGLDVIAALGSDRALDILHKVYSTGVFSGYDAQMQKMRAEITSTKPETWQSNLYYGWLWSLQSLVKPALVGYPSFMRNQAWQDKSLLTALGSWTELRHDTILYGKQSVTECGGGEEEVALPKGYVEPNLEFWTKLKWLNEYTRAGLVSRNLLTPELKDKFDSLGDLIDFCRKITIKELTGKKVTEEEYAEISMYGANLEQLTTSFSDFNILSDADKDMALVADVHTSFGTAMEEGTGRASSIFVVVPIDGKLYLTRGAIYTQYEFEHPAADRLTDEAWQKMLKTGKAPVFAEWVKSFFVHSNKKPAPEFENLKGGC